MKNKKTLIAAVILLALIAGALLAWTFLRPETADGVKTITVTVVHSDTSEKVFEIKTDAADLGKALTDEGLVSGEKGEYGLYITTVDNETADESSQQWWCITKGGEQLMTGADSTPLSDGDKYELTLKTGW